jgi:hypothetical protein
VKRTGVIIILLLSAASTAVSQALRLDVENKPLSRVLDMLDVEISFDDTALSAYGVSVSKTFDSAEEALLWLLRDKPFRIEKAGSVYILVPADINGREEIFSRAPPPANPFVFRGTVIDRTTREPLEYATVSLLDTGSRPVTAAVTNSDGKFLIRLSAAVRRQEDTPASRSGYSFKISYLGYETLSEEAGKPDGEPGVYALKATVFPLDETTVTAGRAQQQSGINRTRYAVTSRMRDGVTGALELLDKIPGLSYDKPSETVRLNNQTNILLLVDGIQHSHAYLKHLSPHRIHAVEVIHAPSGRFVSDDYAAIVHFILKKDYTGYDIHVSEAASLNLSQTAGNDRWAENRPAVGMTYTVRRLNIFGTYSRDRENRNVFSEKYVKYNRFELASVPPERPNSLYEDEINTVTGGLNYRLTPLQIVGIQGDYTSGNMHTRQEYTMRRTDPTQNYDRTLTNITENLTKAHTFTGSLFYRGQLTNRIHLYGDFSYNYYYNLIENEYCQDEAAGYRYEDLYNEYKNQTAFNLEGKYLLSGNMSVEAGYSGIRRRYASGSSQGKGFLDYGEYRNKAFAYFSWYPSDKTGLKAGIALEHIKRQDRATGDSYLRALPFLQINYSISRTANLLASYATNQSYPALYQLSPMSIVIDTFLTQTGNPALKSAVRHSAFVELTLWNSLKVSPRYSFIRDGISEVYNNMEYKLYRTFNNMDISEYSLHASYERTFGLYFRLKGAVMFYHGEALHDNIRSSSNGWIFQTEAGWYHPGMAAGAQAGYYRNMRKHVLWQGYQMSDKDCWRVSIQKELWRKRISVMLSYIPPVPFGVRRDRTKEMDTPLYREKTTLNLSSYNRMLLLNVSLRFEGGGVKKPVEKRIITGNDEREK